MSIMPEQLETEKPEWEFDTPPDGVDLDRLWGEMMGIPAIVAYSYLEQLKTKAPKTYARLRTVRLAAGDTIFNWTAVK